MKIDILIGVVLGLLVIPVLDKMHPEYWGGMSRLDVLKYEWGKVFKKK